MRSIQFAVISAVILLSTMIVSAQSQTPSPTPQPVKTGVSSAYVRPDAKQRAKNYANSLFGPFAIARIVGGAGFSTWTNSPKEWGDNWRGFGRRVASSFGTNVIGNSIQFGMDEALRVDSGFRRSQKRDTGSRIKNALLSTVTARKPNGERVFGAPRIVGTYTSNIIANEVWYPKRYGWKDGLSDGSISLGLNAALNVVREFFLKK